MAYVHSEAQFREPRVVDLEVLGNGVGQDIRPLLSYLPGLAKFLALPGNYAEEWVREFYASVWVALDHSYIHYTLAGTGYRVTPQHARETWGLTTLETKIHELCYSGIEPLDVLMVVSYLLLIVSQPATAHLLLRARVVSLVVLPVLHVS